MMENKGWRIIDNYHENIMHVYFETEERAKNYVQELIKVCKENNKNYDYEVVYIGICMTYQEYMENIED